MSDIRDTEGKTMNNETVPEYVTIQDMVHRFDVTRSRIMTALEQTGIEPIRKMGNVLCYGPDTVEAVRRKLLEISPPPKGDDHGE